MEMHLEQILVQSKQKPQSALNVRSNLKTSLLLPVESNDFDVF